MAPVPAGAEAGKSRRRSLHVTDPQEAQRRLERWLESGGRAQVDRQSGSPFETLTDFLDDIVAEREVKPETASFYRGKLGKPFRRFDHVPLDRWSVGMIRGWLREEMGHASARTRRGILSGLDRFRKWARVRRGLDLPDVTKGIPRPKQVRGETPFLQPVELDALLERVRGEPLEVPIVMAATAGMRCAEIRRSTWSDLRWARGEHLIHGGKAVHGGGAYQVRVNPIDDRIRACLQPLAEDPEEPIYARTITGKDRDWIKEQCRELGIREIGMHGLRHTFATNHLSRGVDIATIGALLGHRPGSPMTMRYLHAHAESKRRAMEIANAETRAAAGGGRLRIVR